MLFRSKLKRAVEGTTNSLLVANIEIMWKDNQQKLKTAKPEEWGELIEMQKNLTQLRAIISKAQGRDV